MLNKTKGWDIMTKKTKMLRKNGTQYFVLEDEIKNMKNMGFTEKSARESIEELESVGLAEIIEVDNVKYFRPLEPNSPYNVLR